MNMKATLDVTPSPRLLQVLGDIPLQPWQCLAELVDNSLDELLKDPNRTHDNPLLVNIEVDQQDHSATYLVVSDNGGGMSADELERSLKAGHSAKNRYGSLGLFGMGFNIATARLGHVTTVWTTQPGSPEMLRATLDFADIQRRESFSVPLEVTQCPPEHSGTTVKVHLKKDMADSFRRAQARKTLMMQLGDVYSYLLRDDVPGIYRTGFSSKVPARLMFDGEPIAPKLPCIWADHRAVTSYGRQVNAIQYIDTKLTEATACLDCGFWDRKNGPETCEECESTNLQVRQRRIWGWIGIQRYIDSSNYGVDFIRYGRKILKLDKSIFVYTDPDTLQTDTEYPIEMPANRGRIVGEIHLDHVPVTYQKNDFDRQSYDWQKAIEVVRGTGPLKPRAARDVNDSPLALLYSAYRRNDPGLRYLVPGDGKQALHSKAQEWAIQFDKGIPRLQEDTEWYQAAQRHQEIKDSPPAGSTGAQASGGSAVATLLGPKPSMRPEDPALPTPREQTQADRLEAARLLGTRHDLSQVFKLKPPLGTWDISIIVTRDTLSDVSGNDVPAIHGDIKGTSLEVFLSSEHSIFREYGRDVRDVALMHAASLIKGLKDSDLSVATIYGDLVHEIPDLRVSSATVLERIDRTLARIRTLAIDVVSEDAEAYWVVLDAEQKQAVEMTAAIKNATASLKDIVADGRFVLYCGPDALASIIADRPGAFFDSRVFKPSLQHRNEAARSRIVGTITRALISLAAFQQDEMLRQMHDLQLAQINLDYLDDQVVTEELLT